VAGPSTRAGLRLPIGTGGERGLARAEVVLEDAILVLSWAVVATCISGVSSSATTNAPPSSASPETSSLGFSWIVLGSAKTPVSEARQVSSCDLLSALADCARLDSLGLPLQVEELLERWEEAEVVRDGDSSAVAPRRGARAEAWRVPRRRLPPPPPDVGVG